MSKSKRKLGRPRVRVIPDTPANVAHAIVQGPPKAEWDFEQEHQTKRKPRES